MAKPPGFNRWFYPSDRRPPDNEPGFIRGGISLNRGRGRPPKWEAQLKAYIKELTEADFSHDYILRIQRVVKRAFDLWDEKDPAKINRDHILAFLHRIPEGQYRVYQRMILNGYLTFCGNYVIRGMRWRDTIDARINVRWLSWDQLETLLGSEMDPIEEIVIRLALDMGLRRIEIARIRLEDIGGDGFLTVRGKGKKLRSVPFPPDFQRCLDRWMQYRDDLLARYPGVDPGILVLVVLHHNKLSPIHRTALDTIPRKVSERVGFHFSFHDLRRTWARFAWEDKIPIETIALILGHRDVKTTLRYIGVNAEHTREAMRLIHLKRLERMGGIKIGRKIKATATEPDTAETN